MLTFMLEPTDDRANPLFKDAAGCKNWLAKLQLTNLQQVHALLLTQINELNRYPMRGRERLDTLESLRDTVHYVQHEYGKRLLAKPLPLGEHELIVFVSIVQLWLAMAHGYQRCLQSLVAGDRQLEPARATLCQRALHYGQQAIYAHLVTGYDVDGRLWHLMHGVYQFAEQQDLLFEKIRDPLALQQPEQSCIQIYLGTLLTDQARPAALSRAQQNLLGIWLPHWVEMLTVERQYKATRGDAPPLAFDLEGEPHGLQMARMVKPEGGVRYLSMVPLSKFIRVRAILLQQGKTPEQVELGNAGTSSDCLTLLDYLHRRWCEEHANDQPGHPVWLASQPETIHSLLAGKPCPENALEHWRVVQESAREIELERITVTGSTLQRRQLLALQRSKSAPFTLAASAWVLVTRTGQLRLGAHPLPGQAEAITLIASDADKPALPKPASAFLLHAIPESHLPPSLIMSRLWFKAGRVAEIVRPNGERQKVRMAFSVEQGTDFERVSFRPE